MKMKLMKWMTVTALATATVFGSFVESAAARIGASFSNVRNGIYTIEFDLIEINESQIERRDENTLFFPDAIENFICKLSIKDKIFFVI